MLLTWVDFFLAIACFGVAVLSASAVVPFIRRKAFSLNLLDLPNRRKAHSTPTPRLGGVALMPGVWIAGSAALLYMYASISPAGTQPLVGLLLGCLGFFGLGLLDDFKGMNASSKLVIQMGMAALVANFFVLPESILGFQVPGAVTWLCFWAWLVVIPNSVNLLDGIDGLTGLLGTFFSFFAAVIFASRGELAWSIVCLGMAGGLVGFLRHNWNPAKIFLGDCGSLAVGFFVAFTSLKLATTSTLEFSPWILVLSTSVWLGDTIWAILRRYLTNAPKPKLMKRSFARYFHFHGAALKSVVRPDRGHFHHLLLDRGYSVKQSSVLLSLVSASALVLSLSFYSHFQGPVVSQIEAFLFCSFVLAIAYFVHRGPRYKQSALPVQAVAETSELKEQENKAA